MQINASYTYSHSLDEGSGLGAGLFFNGNNPLDLRTSYANSDFDRPARIHLQLSVPVPDDQGRITIRRRRVNGWGHQRNHRGRRAESRSASSTSPGPLEVSFTVPMTLSRTRSFHWPPGTTPGQATSNAGGGGNPVNRPPFMNPNNFSIPFLQPGQTWCAALRND